jgi:hypothetical protein
MEMNYQPELDILRTLDPEEANYYQSQIGVLRWVVELGCLDITTEVSMLLSHNALPREGHLNAVFQIFSYLKTKTNARLVLDRWSVAADEQRVTHILSENNVSDIMTKPLPSGAKQDSLVGKLLHDLVNEFTPAIQNARDAVVLGLSVASQIGPIGIEESNVSE